MRGLRLAREGMVHDVTRHRDRGIFFVGERVGSPIMGHGRISFSRHTGGAYAFVPGQKRPHGLDMPGASPGKPARPSGMTEAIVSRLVPEVADQWIMDSIERKRARLRQVSQLQRHRIEAFVNLLFDEDSDRCQEMVEAAVADSGDPQKVVETLLEPAARIIGENWCGDECDFLKVTIAMSRMQRLFRHMAAEFPPAARPDLSRCALLGPAPGEQHTFGLSVVDDAFRRAGWEVDCCGCDEEADMLRLANSNHYQVMGLSVSVERRLSDLVAVVGKLRSKSRNGSVVLIAGGSMVMQNPQGAIDAGFDLLAVDAVSAVALADTVISSRKAGPDQRMAAE